MLRLESSGACRRWTTSACRRTALASVVVLTLAIGSASAQQLPAQEKQPAQAESPQVQSPQTPAIAASASRGTHISPEQGKQLFISVDSILRFDSVNTSFPIRHTIKRRLVTRDEVERYLTDQLHNDRDAKRLERSELVLKKFGLLDRDFQLQPFLIKLLREQIAGYYNDKTKTVNLLDWIPPEQQKPVLAHELTHALQDQYIHLDKWDRQDDLSTPKNVQQDNKHLAVDEQDTVRDAVIEGQAMAVFLDYALAPMGKTLLTAPEIVNRMTQSMSDDSDSPTLASAPLLLQRSLLFPYADGLNFVRSVLFAQGKSGAFEGLLNHPPSSTYEIMTPKIYLKHQPVPLLRMPDIHTLIDPHYRPYDVGAMGELDVQMVTELFGGRHLSKTLTPAWRGGLYYTAQNKDAKITTQADSLASLALLYLSRWATPEAAQAFAAMYGREVPRKYEQANADPPETDHAGEQSITSQVWHTSEGPVLIVVSGRTVFISESFPLDLARKLQLVMMGSIANTAGSEVAEVQGIPAPTELTAGLEHLLSDMGFTWTIPRVQNRRRARHNSSAEREKKNGPHSPVGMPAIY